MEENGERNVENTGKLIKNTEEVGEIENTEDVGEVENTEKVGEVENVSVSEKVAKKKAKRKNIQVSHPSVNELNNSVEVIDKDASKAIIKTNENNSQTKENIKKKKMNIQPTIQNDVSNIEPKTDSSIQVNELSKRQKKNLKKKLKKIEAKKNATPNGKSPSNIAGKKRKRTDSEQVPNKKPKPANNDTELNDNKPINEGKQNKGTNVANKNKNGPTDKIKSNKKDKTTNNNLKNKKDKFKNKQKPDFKKKLKEINNKNKDNDKTDNPMNNLSDERLKAYGLNPKKYRGFLKYKKF